MRAWAETSTFYHIVIDRFATSKNHFHFIKGADYQQDLQQWMGGSINAIVDSLDYLEDLGVQAIMITPFFKGKKYHGYWTTNLRKVDPHFGNKQQLQHFINSAHQRNMYVVMDLPITHCHIEAYAIKDVVQNKKSPYRNWLCFDQHGKLSGFFGDSNLPELNLELPELINILIRMIKNWLDMGFDAIRFDHAKRPSSVFWQNFTGYLKKHHPSVFLLGENWQEPGNIGALSCYLHGELNIPLSKAMRGFVANPGSETIQGIIGVIQDQKQLLKNGYLLPTFLDSPDMERISYLADGNKATIALGYLLQLTLPYPPIIYYGSERAQAQTANLPDGEYERDRFFREPMLWESGSEMAAWVKKLINIRNQHIDFFRSEPFAMKLLGESIFTYSYSNGNSVITVLINITPDLKGISLASGLIENLLTEDCLFKENRCKQFDIKLPGFSGAILKTLQQIPLLTRHNQIK